MTTAAGEDARLAVRAMLITNGGGFLRNVQWIPGLTCDLCAGVPNGGYANCYSCPGWQHRDDLANRLAFGAYAIDGEQSGQVMYGYKSPLPSAANRRVVQLLHHYTLFSHWACFNGSALGPLTHWTTVPSLRGRQGEHPLRSLAAPFFQGSLEFMDLAPAPGAITTRDLRPQNFQATVVPGAHVLLVEDTWVGGGRVQSAAAALKLAGATSVTAFVLARWLDRTRGRTPDLINTIRPVPFDPDLCPFTGLACA